ncbi:MAG: hypothetical protein QM608_00715, partial [Caulobacter sp.]
TPVPWIDELSCIENRCHLYQPIPRPALARIHNFRLFERPLTTHRRHYILLLNGTVPDVNLPLKGGFAAAFGGARRAPPLTGRLTSGLNSASGLSLNRRSAPAA